MTPIKDKIDWYQLTVNESLQNALWTIVLHFQDKPWDWRYLSIRDDLTWEFILEHKTLPWDWNRLSTRPDVTWDIILANLSMSWDLKHISSAKLSYIYHMGNHR